MGVEFCSSAAKVFELAAGARGCVGALVGEESASWERLGLENAGWNAGVRCPAGQAGLVRRRVGPAQHHEVSTSMGTDPGGGGAISNRARMPPQLGQKRSWSRRVE